MKTNLKLINVGYKRCLYKINYFNLKILVKIVYSIQKEKKLKQNKEKI